MPEKRKTLKACGSLAASVLILALSFAASEKLPLAAVKACEELYEAAGRVLRAERETETTTGTEEAENTDTTAPAKEDGKKDGDPADGEYRTPEDVRKLQEDYAASVSEAHKAGTVSEVSYLTTGATDVLGKVAVKNSTAALKPDFEALLREKSDLKVEDGSRPTVLIFHTHTTESYLLTDDGAFYDGYETKSTDPTRNMVRVGDAICEALENNGIGCVHDTTVYDEAYNGAYARSREGVEKLLEENPDVQIILDVHRDAFYNSDTDRVKEAYEINGKKAAQIMIISGAEDSGITDFPDWEYNLRFALELQQKAQEKYYGLMKPLYFCPRRYNMNMAHCSLLLEFGTDANTLEEAVYSGHLMGTVLSEIIKEHS